MKQFKQHKERLRTSGLRPTKQRILIAQNLFEREKTFHFTVETLNREINKKGNKKISLATVYNTVEAFTKAGHIKEILTSKSKSYFDTNIKSHHHFYDEDMSQLVDIKDKNILINYLPKAPIGKKIKSVEVLVKIEDTN